MIVTMGRERSSKERIKPSAFIRDAAGSIFAPSFSMALPRLRISSIPGFIALFSQFPLYLDKDDACFSSGPHPLADSFSAAPQPQLRSDAAGGRKTVSALSSTAKR